MKEVAEKIAEEVRTKGVISFARFMELALYCPVYGYYEREGDTAGRAGDYYTSVSVGSLFGELLAFQLAEWLEEGRGEGDEGRGTRDEGRVQIVEAGAHDGRLAKDILVWLREHRTELFQRLEYWIVEPSARRGELQQGTLLEFSGSVRWFPNLRELAGIDPSGGVRGVIFSNELLDAMPVHRLGWDARNRVWFEWGVGMEEERFVWDRMPGENPKSEIRNPKSCELPLALQEILPDGFTREVCPAAEEWWRQAASILRCGKMLTIDYGLTAEEFYAPERKDGTLRGYYRHHLTGDVLAHPGEQDITSHVNFSAIQSAGEASGLKTEGFLTQAQFLTQIAVRFWKEEESSGLNSARARQLQTLTHPEHLGRAFRVLIQSR